VSAVFILCQCGKSVCSVCSDITERKHIGFLILLSLVVLV
jgi:hypothetical protein